MKKSEMIQIIENTISDMEFAGSNVGDWFSYLFIEELSKQILETMEREGMLPPPLSKDVYRHEAQLGQCVVAEYPEKSLWEPENE